MLLAGWAGARWIPIVGVAWVGCAEPDPARQDEVALELDDGALLSVWGRASEDVVAVGGQLSAPATAGTAVMWRYDGATWRSASSSLPDGTPLLNWVWGTDDAMWVVGNAGAILRDAGAGWEAQPEIVDAPLWGVWGAADDDVWAVGGDAVAGPPVIVHHDGTTWTEHPVPPLDRPAKALFKVWGTAADDVFAVGDAGVILHFDGTTWAQQPSGTGADLISLWGTGPDEIVAAGGRSNGTLARFDGTAWRTEAQGALPGLNGVWVDADGDAVVVGDRGTIAEVDRDGFELTPIAVDGAAAYSLHAVFGFEDGHRFAVGGTLLTNPPWRGVLVQR